MVIVLITISSLIFGQAEIPATSSLPLKSANSLLYGSDVIINDQPAENQRQACLTVAFNGWLYAGYMVTDGTSHKWMIMISTDDGVTWLVLREQALNTDWYGVAMDIVVAGNSVPDLKLFVSRILRNDVAGYCELIVSGMDGNSGGTINTLRDNIINLPEAFLDVAIASDYRFPAVGASPYSIAVLYSKTISARDSIILLTSSNGGVGFDVEKVVTTTDWYARNVSLAYGRCGSFFNGRYFAAWEQRGSSANDLGQIYTAHSDPGFNSDFLAPVRVDNLLSHSADFCRNPSISCQFNDVNNDMSNLTEVILFDRAYDGVPTSFDIVGTYNKEAANSDTWAIFGMYASLSLNGYESDLNYDPGYDNFLATYFNSTDQKLRYLVQGMNMPDPYNWVVIIDQYNTETNLVDPYPKVEINPVYTQVAHVWNGERPSGNGKAMFDAEYSVVGIQPSSAVSFSLTVFPNPASTTIQFSFELPKQENVKISLVSMFGKTVKTIVDKTLTAGRQQISADVSDLPAGCYSYQVNIGDEKISGRSVVL